VISERLAGLLRRELALDTFEFRDETKAFEVPGWDSLRHVELLTKIEEEFGVRFKSLEVVKLKSVGDLQALIDRKTTR